MTVVVGVDQSLSSTGVFAIANERTAQRRVQSKPAGEAVEERAKRLARQSGGVLRAIRECLGELGVRSLVDVLFEVDVVVIEGPSYGSQSTGQSHYLAGFWWTLSLALVQSHLPVAVAAPGTVKKFATGSGRAGKDEMLAAAIRAFPEARISNNDVADAAALAGLGAAFMNVPAGRWPGKGRDAVLAVRWPSISKGEK